MISLSTYCSLTNHQVIVNGEIVSLETDGRMDTAVYKHLKLAYPKFHKMDTLAKRAFVGVELLKQANPAIETYPENDIALLFANSESSENADVLFQQSYADNGTPSPSQFVYTLPNIMLGEVAIRNKWYGENLFLFMPEANAEELIQQVQLQFANGHQACILAWVNVTDSDAKSVFCFLENKVGNELTIQSLNQLIN